MTVDATDPFGISGKIIAEKYFVEKVIGEGGFSVVYKAEHTIWQQPVALKCFKILANAPVEHRDRLLRGFIDEGKLMAKLSSRSAAIVQARDVGTFTAMDGSWIPYMVLEWLEGRPLDSVLWDERIAGMRPRELHEVLALLEPAAIAFEIAHSNGIAHRDIKPENLFVIGDARGMDNFVKVLDFGIAKVMGDEAAAGGLAQTSAVPTAFTPSHGAPEQFSRSHGATGPWTDVFAMALVIVEILRGGQAALQGDDYMQLAVASRDPQNRPTPRFFGLEVSTAVEAVFAKALAVSPQDRYPTMGQFWSALHHSVFPDSATWNPGSTGGIPSIAPGAPGDFGSTRPSRVSIHLGDTKQRPQAVIPVNITGQPASVMTPSMMSSMPPSPASIAAPMPVAPSSSKSPLILGVIGALALLGGAVGAYMMFIRPKNPPQNNPPGVASSTVVAPPAASSAAVALPARRTECPPEMVLVPGGRFFMGSDDESFKLWQPAHKVTLDTFCIDTTEVTVEAYRSCSDNGDCKRPDPIPNYPKTTGPKEISDEAHEKIRTTYSEFCNFGVEGREKHPINCVSWELADAFCKAKQKRLPTEAEWEFAARGSDGRKFPWGEEPGDAQHMNAAGLEFNKWETAHKLPTSDRMYNTDDGFAGTAPVGSFPKGKTKFGAYDFIGNVWEWTADWFETYKPDEQVNPKGAPAGERKVIRGGAFNGGVQLWLNPAFRYHQVATASSHGIGFRCALTL